MQKNMIASIVLGSMFLLCGISWLVANLGGWNIDFSMLWPIFMLIPGILLITVFVLSRQHDPGVLIPGVILTIMSLGFFFNLTVSRATGSNLIWTVTIFMYPGAAAAAFWAAWLVRRQDFRLAFAAMILSAVSLFLLCFFSLFAIAERFFTNSGVGRFIWPLALICVGIIILLTSALGASLAKRNRNWEQKAENFGKKVEAWGEQLEKKFENIDRETAAQTEPASSMAQEAEIVGEKKNDPENINNNY